MDVDDSPSRRRPSHSHNMPPESPRTQLSGTLSFSRNLRADGVSTRSPFSKLMSSSYNSQTPVKTTSTQSQRYSENAVNLSGHGAARPFSTPAVDRESVTSGRTSLHSDLALSQTRRSLHTATISPFQTRDNPKAANNNDRNPYSEIGEGYIEESDLHSYGSSRMTQLPQQSFKKESDSFSSPFQASMRFHHDTRNKSITPSIPEKDSTYRSATPYRYDSPTDGGLDVLDQQRDAEPCSISRDINAQDDHSRSPSIAVLTREQPGDDLSTLMFKGATDLRNANLALEGKTKAMQQLQEELNAVTGERNSLLRRITLVKEKAKDGLESHAKKLGDMNNELQSLKTQSQEYFLFAQKARASMADVEELKGAVKKSSDQLETSVGEDGIYTPTQGWKSVLSELQTNMANKQQVIDMFRDRLEFAQGELADAKNRIAELESTQMQNTDALRSTSAKLGDAGERINELATLLRVQQQKNTDILMKNAELETELVTHVSDNSELSQRLSQKEIEFQTFAPLQGELGVLRKLLEDRDEHIRVLHGSKDRAARAEGLLEDRRSRIDILEASVEIKDKSIESLQKRLLLAEAQAENQVALSRRLEEDLNASRTQVKIENDFRVKIFSEKDALKSREEALVAETNGIKKDLEDYRIKLRQSETRLEMLQERFEDQAMMLRMEKKGHGDVQERLFSAETAYTKTIEDTRRKADTQIAHLKEHVSTLESQLRGHQAELSAKVQESSSTLSDMEVRHAQDMRENKERLAAKSDEATRLQKDLNDSKDESQSLQRRIQSLQLESSNLQNRLSETMLPSQAHIEELTKLKLKIEGLQKNGEAQAQRARTIVLRYEQGNLCVEEKKLIDTVHRASQTSHEQQLVARGNEIRQRDNAIKALEKRKAELESQLARVLNTQARTKAGTAPMEGGRSLIDLDGWMSSQTSSSPRDGKTNLKAPDRDRPTTMIEVEGGPDNAVSTLRTPVVKAKANLPSSDSSTPTAKSYQSTRVNVSPPRAPTFAKLAEKTADLSDDAHALDDDVALADVTTTKRKRAPVAPSVEESEKARPLRRTRTATRAMSRTADDPESETSLKGSAAVPKVKARKRR